MFELTYVSPDGKNRFEMLSGGEGPFIVLDSLSGMVGEFSDTQIQTVGMPGARVDFRDRVIAPMSGSFALVVLSGEQWLDVRRSFSTTKYGKLELSRGGNVLETPVRLSATLPPPGGRPKEGTQIQVALVSDGEHGGYWSRRYESADTRVTVTNNGDVPIWPEIVWNGAGGDVTLPSGAKITLPRVAVAHVVSLARDRVGLARPLAEGTWSVPMWIDAVSEQVPVGETRTFQIPDGANLRWREGVLDPWI